MKRGSEAAFGEALRAIDDSVPTFVYRLPDPKAGGGVSNWKPCDYMAWNIGLDETAYATSHWFECKDTDAARLFNLKAELRPSQRQGIREATRLGIDYWIATYWRRQQLWSISDAVRLNVAHMLDRSLSFDTLSSVYGIEAAPSQLSSILKSIMAGEV